jgi:hypothetical protein
MLVWVIKVKVSERVGAKGLLFRIIEERTAE